MLIGPRTRLRQELQLALLRTVVFRHRVRIRIGGLERRGSGAAATGRTDSGQEPRITLLCIYRQRNARILTALLGQVPPASQVLLWCLDDVVPDLLATRTVGQGPGTRWMLLNRLLDAALLGPSDWVVVADDDVFFTRGDVLRFVKTAAQAGFDLCQPAHSFASTQTYLFNRGRLLARANLVGFVEIGPIFAVAPHLRQRFLPFPEDNGMGWGTEVEWSRERRRGARLGLVNTCRMVHCGSIGTSYNRPEAQTALDRILEEHGMGTIEELLEVYGSWRPWQRSPAWIRK